jgi:hypothetical protein
LGAIEARRSRGASAGGGGVATRDSWEDERRRCEAGSSQGRRRVGGPGWGLMELARVWGVLLGCYVVGLLVLLGSMYIWVVSLLVWLTDCRCFRPATYYGEYPE